MSQSFLSLSLALSLAGCSRHAAQTNEHASGSVATVQTVPLHRQVVSETLTLYGTTVSGVIGSQTLSLPYESHVIHVLVRVGQRVDGGAPVIEVEPSPATRLAIQQARSQAESTHEKLRIVKQALSSQLATSTQLETAEESARLADLQLAMLLRNGSDGSRALLVPSLAVIAKVHVTEGAIVPAGNPLVDFDFRNHREARFAVEAEDVPRIGAVTHVDVSNLELPPSVTVRAVVRAVSDSVDPQTRMVNLFASLPATAPFMLNQRVTGTLHITGAPTLAVPRSALLPIEDRLVVFTVRDNHAVSHTVRVGLETEQNVEVLGSDLAEGDAVVVVGVPVLENGMAVRVEGGP